MNELKIKAIKRFAVASIVMSKSSMNTTCGFFNHQPVVPYEVKKFKKMK